MNPKIVHNKYLVSDDVTICIKHIDVVDLKNNKVLFESGVWCGVTHAEAMMLHNHIASGAAYKDAEHHANPGHTDEYNGQ